MSKRKSVVGGARRVVDRVVAEALETRQLLSLPALSVSAIDASASESGGYALFRITRTGLTTKALNVSYALGGTASVGADYKPIGAVRIPAGQSSVNVRINPIDDAAVEPTETVVFRLSSNAAYRVGSPSSATARIIDNDLQTVWIQPVDAIASEDGDPASFRVFRRGDVSNPLQVYYSTSGSAVEGLDYQYVNNIVIPAGETSTLVTITPAQDDLSEGPESAVVTLKATTRYEVGVASSFTAAILDDDLTEVSVTALEDLAFETGAPGGFLITRGGGDINEDLPISFLMSGTATEGDDYAAIGQIVIPAGETSATVDLSPLEDLLVEGNETATLTIQAGDGYNVVSPSSATITIRDDEKPILSIVADSETTMENEEGASFIVTRLGDLSEPIQMLYAESGTATIRRDYQAFGYVLLPAGEQTVYLSLLPIDDVLVEGSETLTLTLLESANYTLSETDPLSATVTIIDDELPALTAVATVNKATEGSVDGLIQITRTGDLTQTLTLNYELSGDAVSGFDFAPLGVLTMGPGVSTLDVSIEMPNDGMVESDVYMNFLLLDGDNYQAIGDELTIKLVDGEKNIVTVVASEPNADEDQLTSGEFTITRQGSTDADLTINYTMNGTAVGGTDYAALGSLVIPAGETTITVELAPTQDAKAETAETAIFTLNGTAACEPGDPASATVTIASSDQPFMSVIAAIPALEEMQQGMFTIMLSEAINAPVIVNFTLTGEAIEGTDYDTVGGITIPANTLSVDVLISAIADTIYEGDETIIMTLSAGASYRVSPEDSVAEMKLLDNEPAKVGVVAKVESTVEGSADPAVFTVYRTGNSFGPMTVQYRIGGTAQQGIDYQSISSIIIPSGVYAYDVSIQSISDNLLEGDETVTLTILDTPAVVLDTTYSASVTIEDPAKALSLQLMVGQGAEGGANPIVRVKRFGNSASELTLNYLLGGTAVNGVDYAEIGDIVFAEGQSSIDVEFEITDDELPQLDRSILFSLLPNEGYDLTGLTSISALIKDNDPVVVSVEIGVQSAPEQPYLIDMETGENAGVANPFTFIFRRVGNTDQELIVAYNLEGTALSSRMSGDYDYTLSSGLQAEDENENLISIDYIIFPVGVSSVVLRGHPADDLLTEGIESVILTLAPAEEIGKDAVVYAIDEENDSATAYITDNDVPEVSLLAPGNTLNEEGPGSLTVTVSRIGSWDNALTLSFILSGDAVQGVDFTGLGTVVIPAGQQTASFTLTAIDDALLETTEWFTLSLMSTDAYTADPYAQSLQFKIVDNEPVRVSVQAAGNASENGTPGYFTLSRSGSLDLPLLVDYSLEGSATSGLDYLSPGILLFQQGQSSMTIPVSALDDSLVEHAETIVFSLVATESYVLGESSQATINIADNDEVTPPVAVDFKVAGINKTASSSTLRITYRDDTGVRAASITRGDVEIYGPNGFHQIASLHAVSSSVDAENITAVYRFIPSGFAWTSANVGTYTVYIRPNQVKDVYGNAMPLTKVGKFVVKAAKTRAGFSVATTSYAVLPDAAPVPKSATKRLLFSDTPIL